MSAVMFDALLARRALLLDRILETAAQCDEHTTWDALLDELDRIDAYLTLAKHPEAPDCCD
jgi:hypothetical protein